MQNIALDRGYDTGAVHRGLELLGITGYIPAIQFSNSPEKYGFYYLPQEDAFCCPEGAKLVYQRLNCSQTTGKYLRCYQVQGDTCRHCKQNATCFKQTGVRRRILGSSCYPAFYRGHERIGSDTYWHMMRLRKIWAEGSFSVLKREHCLSKIRKRGIPAVTEECLLSAMALNLKRMVRAILLTSHMLKIGAESLHFLLRFLFCQQVPYLTLSRSLNLICPVYQEIIGIKKAPVTRHCIKRRRRTDRIFLCMSQGRTCLFCCEKSVAIPKNTIPRSAKTDRKIEYHVRIGESDSG